MKRALTIILLSVSIVCQAQVTYTVTSIPYTPDPYDNGFTMGGLADDSYSKRIPIGFDFSFFGIHNDSFVVSSNGGLSFDLHSANGFSPWLLTNITLPTSVPALKNCILAVYTDLDLSIGGLNRLRKAVYGTTPNRRVVISYDSIPMFSCNTMRYTGQIVLYERTSVIDIHIKNKPLCASWNNGDALLGIQSQFDTLAYFPPNRNGNSQWVATNESWRFTPSDSAWALAVSKISRNDLQVYPNPSRGGAHILSEEGMWPLKVEIINTMGQSVRKLIISEKDFTLNQNDLPNGLYFLIHYSDYGKKVTRILFK